MSPQLSRILIFLAVVGGAYAFVRPQFLPESYGDAGPYRLDAVVEEAARVPIHAGLDACVECHEDQGADLAGGAHSTLSCETCHRASPQHVEEPERFAINWPREESMRQHCGACHQDRVGRPDFVPVIDIEEHELARDGTARRDIKS